MRVNDGQPASSAGPQREVVTETDSAKWTLVSRLTSSLAGAQAPGEASSSGRSSPSNLERAVLLLEAEGDPNSQAGAVRVAVVQAPKATAAPAPDQAKPGARAWAARAQAAAVAEEGGAVDLSAQRSALRVVGMPGGNAREEGNESAEEGPSTPPASGSGLLRSSAEASTPGSTAGTLQSSAHHWPCSPRAPYLF